MNFKDIVKKILNDKKTFNTIIIFLIGFGLIIISSFFSENEEKTVKTMVETNILKETEEKLKNLILSIDGVKKAEVMICFSDMGIKEYYKDETEDYNGDKIKTDKKIVLKESDGNEVPVLRRELYPEIKGVSVIADCTDKKVYDLIFKAVKASLGTEPHKIEIIINDRSKK